MNKEIKILSIAFALFNFVLYLAFSFGSLSLAPSQWHEFSRVLFAALFSGSFIGCLAWILFKPEK